MGFSSNYDNLHLHTDQVVLSRPDKLNTMTPTFFDEVGAAFKQLNEDDEVNVILV